MKEIHILIVEDHNETRQSWERDIREFNRKPDLKIAFIASFVTTRDAAINAIHRSAFDCAVVDLRLPRAKDGELPEGPLGNDVVAALLENSGVPAVVYSAYVAEVGDHVAQSHIKVVTKAGGASLRILSEFSAQADLMEAMRQTRLVISKQTSRLFNESIWPRWQHKWSKSIDKETVNIIIARQTASHISAALSDQPSRHHPEEFYVVPALHSDRLDTGDILAIGKGTYVVLTPRCNMANNKQPKNLLLAAMTDVPDWPAWKDALLGQSNSKRDKAADRIRSHATQGHEISTHFLPPLDGKGPWLVQFQEARTVKSSAAARLIPRRIASIAPQFVPNLVQRYAAYLGRIGQPDIGSAELEELCKA